MQLLIAEKPSVARDLARVLGVRASGQHAFEDDRRVITWCIGHLVELDEPAAYDERWKAWRLDTLPMLPAAFQLRASKHAAPHLKAVVALLRDRRFTSVVNACDAGREGELIFRYVYQYAKAKLPVQRLWISSLTDEAIRRGLGALRPGRELDALGDAARSRSEADWLVGMNATRAITAKGRMAGHDALYTIGRVQTPTLAMLVEREQAIRAFVPRAYWEVRAELRTAAGHTFQASWRHGKLARLATGALADEVVGRDHAHRAAGDPVGPRVERVRSRTVHEPPPMLFDLTSLQRTANRRFGFSAARTLEIAQALYERHKLLTYPRTDSRHLSTDVVPELPGVFGALAAVPDYAPFAERLIAQPPRPSRRVVDDAKVSDHHAIIPTAATARLGGLDRDELRVFDLVARRFLGVFFPDAEIAATEVWIRVGPGAAHTLPAERIDERDERADRAERGGDTGDGEVPMVTALPPPPDRYLARGRVRLVAGWQEVAGVGAASDGGSGRGDERGGRGDERGEREGAAPAALPILAEGEALDGAFRALARETTPPPRYTEATLLGAMEAAGKAMDDDEARAAMKDRGLGTPATRASIIETLLRRAYVVRDKTHLVPTPMGIGLVEGLPVESLASPELTGAWEARLARIARGEDTRAAFMADITRYVEELVGAIRGAPPPAAPPPGEVVSQARGGEASPSPCRGERGGASPSPRRGERGGASPSPRRGERGGASPSPRRGERGGASPSPRRGERGGASPSPRRGERGGASPSSGRAEAVRDRGDAPARDRGGEPARARTSGSRGPAVVPLAPPGSAWGPSSHDATAPVDHGAALARLEAPTLVARASSSSRSLALPAVAPARPRARPVGDGSTAPARPRARPVGDGSTAPALKRARPAGDGTAPVRPRAGIAAPALGARLVDLVCPRCQRGVLITGSRGWGCERFREGCTFVIWFDTAGRRLTAGQLRELVVRGKTKKAPFAPLRGGAAGSEIEGRLILDPTAEGGTRFEPG